MTLPTDLAALADRISGSIGKGASVATRRYWAQELRALASRAVVPEGWVCVPLASFPGNEDACDSLFEAWVSVNHRIDRQAERFTFCGDYGNWLACYMTMLKAAPLPPAVGVG